MLASSEVEATLLGVRAVSELVSAVSELAAEGSWRGGEGGIGGSRERVGFEL